MSFLDVILNGGFVNMFSWACVFITMLSGWAVGVVSVLTSRTRTREPYPLAFKLLLLALLLFLIVGAMGAMNGIFGLCVDVETASGAEKAQLMAIAISNSLYILGMTLVGAIPHMVLIFVSLVIMHRKRVSMPTEDLSGEQVAK